MDFVLETLRAALKDRYRVDAMIGRGGMATVYGAEDLRHGRRVAIKVLSPDLAASLGAERFAREIRIAARLQHPNILTVFDSGEADGLLYYVMPFVEGESLRDRIRRETHIAIDDAIQITCEAAEALGYAHGEGVVHRDIKPENILLQNGRVLVSDFGIARATERSEEKLTGTGMSIGTAAYMSPEQAAGEVADGRADIYALGCTLYEMLTGQPPFTGTNPMAVMARHAFEPVPSIRVVRSSVPEELEASVDRALEKVPADRFQTMDQFRRAVLGEIPAAATGVTSRYTARYRTAGGRKARFMIPGRAVVAIAVGIVLLAVGIGVARQRWRHPSAAGTDANRVAVLYFDDNSNGPLRYVADGLTESLIERLSDVSAIDVISPNGVRSFRGGDVSVDSIGRALGVGSVVRGSVEPDGAKVRVTVRLFDAPSNADIAHKSLSIDTSSIVTVQGQVASQVVDFLRERLGDEVRLRNDRASTKNSAAWILVERAEKLRKDADSVRAGGAPEAAVLDLARADSLLAQAETLDQAWSKIPARRAAVAYGRSTLLAGKPELSRAVTDSGLVYADRALRLQPNDADALEAKGQIQYTRYTQHLEPDLAANQRLLARAESTLRRAVDANKNQAGAWVTLSSLYYSKPDIQAANIAANSAYGADAYLAAAKGILMRLFWTSHDLEQYPEALKWCNEGRRRFPADPFFTECRLWMYTTRFEKPDVDSAWTYAARYVALTPEANRAVAGPMSRILVAGALARAQLSDSARHVLLRARVEPSLDPHRELEGFEAVMRVILADQDEAVRLLTDYLTVNPDHRAGFAKRVGPWWRDLQTNPRFRALLAGAR